MSVTVLSRVRRHASLVASALCSAGGPRGEPAPGGPEPPIVHGDHGHGSAGGSARPAWPPPRRGSSASLLPPAGAGPRPRRPTPRRRSRRASPRPGHVVRPPAPVVLAARDAVGARRPHRRPAPPLRQDRSPAAAAVADPAPQNCRPRRLHPACAPCVPSPHQAFAARQRAPTPGAAVQPTRPALPRVAQRGRQAPPAEGASAPDDPGGAVWGLPARRGGVDARPHRLLRPHPAGETPALRRSGRLGRAASRWRPRLPGHRRAGARVGSSGSPPPTSAACCCWRARRCPRGGALTAAAVSMGTPGPSSAPPRSAPAGASGGSGRGA